MSWSWRGRGTRGVSTLLPGAFRSTTARGLGSFWRNSVRRKGSARLAQREQERGDTAPQERGGTRPGGREDGRGGGCHLRRHRPADERDLLGDQADKHRAVEGLRRGARRTG